MSLHSGAAALRSARLEHRVRVHGERPPDLGHAAQDVPRGVSGGVLKGSGVARDRTKRTIPIRNRSEFLQNLGFFARKFKKVGNFQHFPEYRRNSDKISSKSEQQSVKRIQK